MSSIGVGIGGWTFAPWRGSFYPKGLPHAQELAWASQRVTSIEINGTFYRTQSPASFEAWRAAVPDGFVFAVKASRATTQAKDLTAVGPAIERFLGSGLTRLGPKLGPILWQFAPTKKFDAGLFTAWLALLPPEWEGVTLRHAIEARHATFQDPAWTALLRAQGVAQVIVDSDKQALLGDLTAPFVYARLQRNAEAAPEGYDSAALDQWAARAKAWANGRPVTDLPCLSPPEAAPRDCYVYFISGDKVRAPDAAQAMLRRLGAD